MQLHETDASYNDSYNAMVRRNETVPPMINVVGSGWNDLSAKYFVDFDNIRYTVPTFEVAVDTVFKTYYVFNIAVPEPAVGIIQLLNAFFYRVPEDPDTALPPLRCVNILLDALKSTKSQ